MFFYWAESALQSHGKLKEVLWPTWLEGVGELERAPELRGGVHHEAQPGPAHPCSHGGGGGGTHARPRAPRRLQHHLGGDRGTV